MKNIQKFLIALAIGIFIVPQISLAAGGNPFSGKVFNKKMKPDNQTVKIQQLENKIKELEQKNIPKNVVQKTTSTTLLVDVTKKNKETSFVSAPTTTVEPMVATTIVTKLLPVQDEREN